MTIRNDTNVPTSFAAAAPTPTPLAEGEHSRDGWRSLTADQLTRWADFIAAGDEVLPSDLDPSQLEELIERVRRLRHARLVGFIAAQIALEIHRQGPSAEPVTDNDDDDQSSGQANHEEKLT